MTQNAAKTAMIVGASSGIGLETAKLLLRNGYSVINISRTPAPAEYKINNLKADASEPGSLKKTIDAAAALYAGPDVLVYSAGYSLASPIEFVEEEDYRYLFEVNFFGILEAMKAVIPYMKSRGGGRIILVSSMAGTLPIAFDAFYSASKAAVDMLAEAAAIELKPFGIRVSSVKPGGVSTEFTFKRKVYPDETIGEYADKQHKAVSGLAAMEQGGMDAERVAQTIMSLINSQRPPVKIAAGMMNKTYLAAAKLLPLRVVHFFNSSKYDN